MLMIFIKIKYLKYIFIYFIKIMVTKIYSTAPINNLKYNKPKLNI